MTEADLNMTEVRIVLPERRALALYGQICDGKISEFAIGDDVKVSLLPIANKDPATDVTFTESFPDREGSVTELVTQACFQSFAEHEIQARDAEFDRETTQSLRHLATRSYNALMRNLGTQHVHWGHHPDSSSDHMLPLGIRADLFDGIIEEIRSGSIETTGLGKGSLDFVDRFATAFQEFRKTQTKATEDKLVELGAAALTTQGHELALRYGTDTDERDGTKPDLGSQTGIGTIDDEAFATVIPPLSDEEIAVLEWADVISSDEVEQVDESCSIVGVKETGSLEEKTGAATIKAAEITRVFNHYKIRDEVTVISARPVDFTKHTD